MRVRFIAFGISLFIFAAFLFGCLGPTAPSSEKPDLTCKSLMMGDASIITLEQARTTDEITKGLSNRDSLCKSCGMLFTFEKPAIYQFWMKDMRFPLDIVFMDKDFRVIYVSQNAQPCPLQGECPLITPPSQVKYVLEVNAGYVADHTLVPNSFVACVP